MDIVVEEELKTKKKKKKKGLFKGWGAKDQPMS